MPSGVRAESSEEYWARIGSSVLLELERRLGSSADASDLPGTLLMRLAEQYLKYLDKKAQEEEEDLEYMSALEAIDQEGLPDEAKIQILNDYIDKLNSDLELAKARLEELNGAPQMHEPESSV